MEVAFELGFKVLVDFSSADLAEKGISGGMEGLGKGEEAA